MESKVFKVIITAFVIMMLVVSVSAQVNPTLSSEQVSETERLIDKYSSKVHAFFESVAGEIKTSAEYAAKSYMEYKVAESMVKIISWGIALSVGISLLVYGWKLGLKSNVVDLTETFDDDNFTITLPLGIGVIISVVSMLGFLVSISINLPIILAPEVFLIQELAKSL